MQLPDQISVREVALSAAPEADAYLSESERTRAQGFKSADRRRTFALGRYAARTLLSERLGRPALEIGLLVEEDGSVTVEDHELNLSISHSREYAAAAVAPHDIGLDLEAIRPRPESLFRFILHPDEISLIERIPLSTDQQIVLFWALKEAVLKGKRTGLRRSPKSLRLDIDLHAGRATVRGQRRWEARFDLRDDHVLAIAWPRI